MSRTTDETILNSRDDAYMNCPNCGSFHIYRDVIDGINSCHGCGFTHFVGSQTVSSALANLDKSQESED